MIDRLRLGKARRRGPESEAAPLPTRHRPKRC